MRVLGFHTRNTSGRIIWKTSSAEQFSVDDLTTYLYIFLFMHLIG